MVLEMAYPYRRRYIPKGDHPLFLGRKWVDEHRIIMAEKLGRPLLKTEIVHHKDHNGFNNNEDNLELLNWGEHSRLHNKGHIKSTEEREKRKKALKGLKRTPEQCENIRQAQLRYHKQRKGV